MERREVVPGVSSSSLTTCDELREARGEIKRVPENSRGSARSNYLHEARGARTDRGVDIFSWSFLYFPARPALSPSHFLRSAFVARHGDATGANGGNYFGLLFAPGFGERIMGRRSGERKRRRRYVELAELNTTHKLRGGPSRSETNGGQEFNFISQ